MVTKMNEESGLQRYLYVMLVLTGIVAASRSAVWLAMDNGTGRIASFVFIFCIAFAVTPALRLPQDDIIDLDAVPVIAAAILLPIKVIPAVVVLGDIAGQVPGRIMGYARDRSLSLMFVRACSALGVAWISGELIPKARTVLSVRDMLILLISGAVYVCADLVIGALRASVQGGFLARHWSGRWRLLGPIYAGQICIGAGIVVVFPHMGYWGLVIMTILSSILVNAFNMYLKIRRAYQQTVEALARVSALQFDYLDPEPERVADLAIKVGRRLSLSAPMLETLGYSALLHDIGRITDGEASGDAHAVRGAEIVASIPFLAHIEPIVRLHHATVADLASCDNRDAICASIVHLCDDFLRLADANKNICQFEALNYLASQVGVLYRTDVYEALSHVLSVEPGTTTVKNQLTVM